MRVSTLGFVDVPFLCSERVDPVSDRMAPLVDSTGEEFASCAMVSFALLRYLSLSFSARSKSLLSPRIIALCLSTRRHNCAFWAA